VLIDRMMETPPRRQQSTILEKCIEEGMGIRVKLRDEWIEGRKLLRSYKIPITGELDRWWRGD